MAIASEPQPPRKPDDIRAEVLRALSTFHLPQELQPQAPPPSLLGVEFRETDIPPLLERGLSQSGVSLIDLWIKTIELETTIKYLERDAERITKDIEKIDEKRWSEGRMIAIIALLLGLAVAGIKVLG